MNGFEIEITVSREDDLTTYKHLVDADDYSYVSIKLKGKNYYSEQLIGNRLEELEDPDLEEDDEYADFDFEAEDDLPRPI